MASIFAPFAAATASDDLSAYTHWYADSTAISAVGPTETGNTGWRDIIGARIFDTEAIAARWQDDTLYLAMVTRFPNRNVESAGRPVSPADLALDLDGDGTWETGIVLSDIRATGDRGVTRPAEFRAGNAYTVTRWHQPSDILQTTYGGQWLSQAKNHQDSRAGNFMPVWIAEGVKRDDLQVSVTWQPMTDGVRHSVLIAVSAKDGNAQLGRMNLFWGTAVCGNDSIYAPVARHKPTPVENIPKVKVGGPIFLPPIDIVLGDGDHGGGRTPGSGSPTPGSPPGSTGPSGPVTLPPGTLPPSGPGPSPNPPGPGPGGNTGPIPTPTPVPVPPSIAFGVATIVAAGFVAKRRKNLVRG